MCNNSQVPGPSKAILLLLSLPPALPFLFSLHLPCLPFRARKNSALQGTFFCFVVFLGFFFLFLFAVAFYFVKSLLHCGKWVLWWHLWFLFLRWRAPPGRQPCQECRRCSRSFICSLPFYFFFSLKLLPLPCSRLLVSSPHCSVPLNVLTMKHVGRVLYLCSVFAKYENVSMQYQSDEWRRVDQRQRKYLEGF